MGYVDFSSARRHDKIIPPNNTISLEPILCELSIPLGKTLTKYNKNFPKLQMFKNPIDVMGLYLHYLVHNQDSWMK